MQYIFSPTKSASWLGVACGACVHLTIITMLSYQPSWCSLAVAGGGGGLDDREQ